MPGSMPQRDGAVFPGQADADEAVFVDAADGRLVCDPTKRARKNGESKGLQKRPGR